MDRIEQNKSIEDLINSIEDPEQRKHAMELLNSVLELQDENDNLSENIAELERDIRRLIERKKKMLGEDNN